MKAPVSEQAPQQMPINEVSFNWSIGRLRAGVALATLTTLLTGCTIGSPKASPRATQQMPSATQTQETPAPASETPSPEASATPSVWVTESPSVEPTPAVTVTVYRPEPTPSPTPSDTTEKPKNKSNEPCAVLIGNTAAKASLDTVLKKYLQEKFVDAHRAPGGAVVVNCGDQPITSVTFGRLTYDSNKEVTLATKYDVSSVTKIFTSLGILMLHEKKLLDIDKPIREILPEYAKSDIAKSTIRQLLQHRSGLVDGRYSQVIKDSSNPRQIEKNLFKQPVTKDQIGKYHYSNFGVSIAAIAASRQLKRPLNEVIDEEIFKPLGMKNSGYHPKSNCAPTMSDYDDEKFTHCELQDKLARLLLPNKRVGHAGVSTSASDAQLFLAEMNKAFHGKSSIIPQTVVKTMCKPQGKENESDGYGYGTGMRINTVKNAAGIKRNFGDKMSSIACGHTGWNGTHLVWDQSTDLSVAFLSNGTYGKHMETQEEGFAADRRGANNRVVEALHAALKTANR